MRVRRERYTGRRDYVHARDYGDQCGKPCLFCAGPTHAHTPTHLHTGTRARRRAVLKSVLSVDFIHRPQPRIASGPKYPQIERCAGVFFFPRVTALSSSAFPKYPAGERVARNSPATTRLMRFNRVFSCGQRATNPWKSRFPKKKKKTSPAEMRERREFRSTPRISVDFNNRLQFLLGYDKRIVTRS